MNKSAREPRNLSELWSLRGEPRRLPDLFLLPPTKRILRVYQAILCVEGQGGQESRGREEDQSVILDQCR